MRSIRSSRPCGVRWRSSPSVWTSPNGCSRRTARASGSDRVNERRREEPMEVLIPIIAVGGFFGTVIAFILSRTYLAKLKAQSQAGGAAGQEDVLAAVEELRRGMVEIPRGVRFSGAELAESLGSRAESCTGGKRFGGSWRQAPSRTP